RARSASGNAALPGTLRRGLPIQGRTEPSDAAPPTDVARSLVDVGGQVDTSTNDLARTCPPALTNMQVRTGKTSPRIRRVQTPLVDVHHVHQICGTSSHHGLSAGCDGPLT